VKEEGNHRLMERSMERSMEGSMEGKWKEGRMQSTTHDRKLRRIIGL
jgi:hypothetical protein